MAAHVEGEIGKPGARGRERAREPLLGREHGVGEGSVVLGAAPPAENGRAPIRRQTRCELRKREVCAQAFAGGELRLRHEIASPEPAERRLAFVHGDAAFDAVRVAHRFARAQLVLRRIGIALRDRAAQPALPGIAEPETVRLRIGRDPAPPAEGLDHRRRNAKHGAWRTLARGKHDGKATPLVADETRARRLELAQYALSFARDLALGDRRGRAHGATSISPASRSRISRRCRRRSSAELSRRSSMR